MTLPHNWISRIFGFFKIFFCLPQIIAIGKIKDFWIFSFPKLFTLPHDWKSRIFGFFWRLLSFLDHDTQRSRIFGFFYFLKYSHFHTVGIKGFLDFFISYNIDTFTPLEFKDFWIFKELFFVLTRSSQLVRSRICGFFHFLNYSHFHTIGSQGFLDLFWRLLSFLDHNTLRSRIFGFFLFLKIFTLQNHWN